MQAYAFHPLKCMHRTEELQKKKGRSPYCMITSVIELSAESDMPGGAFAVFVIVRLVVEFLILAYIGLYIGFMIDSRGFSF